LRNALEGPGWKAPKSVQQARKINYLGANRQGSGVRLQENISGASVGMWSGVRMAPPRNDVELALVEEVRLPDEE